MAAFAVQVAARSRFSVSWAALDEVHYRCDRTVQTASCFRVPPRGLFPDSAFGREQSNSTGGTRTRVAPSFTGAHLNPCSRERLCRTPSPQRAQRNSASRTRKPRTILVEHSLLQKSSTGFRPLRPLRTSRETSTASFRLSLTRFRGQGGAVSGCAPTGQRPHLEGRCFDDEN